MKSKFAKLAVALLTTLGLAATLAVPAFAGEAPTVGVQPEEGTLVVHKYKLSPDEMQGVDGNEPGTGVELPNFSAENPGFEPLDGITFTVYPVALAEGQAYPAPGAIKLVKNGDPTQGFTDSGYDPDSADAAAHTFAVGAGKSQTTAGGGLATFADLPQGIYLVVESASTLVDVPAAPFVVMVPMTNPEGAGWLDTVHVYPKNEKLSFEKTVAQPAVGVGDEIVWTLTPQLPSDLASIAPDELDAENSTYVVTDALDAALDFVEVGDIHVGTSTLDANGDIVFADGGTTLVENTDYIVDYDSATNTVKVTLTADGITALKTADATCLRFDITTTANEGILAAKTVGKAEKRESTKTTLSSNPIHPRFFITLLLFVFS